MKRVSSSRSRSSGSRGFSGSRRSYSGGLGKSFLRSSSSSRYRNRNYYGSGRYRLWNSLSTGGKFVYVIVLIIILILLNLY